MTVRARNGIADGQRPLIAVLMPAENGLYAVALQNRYHEVPYQRALQIGLSGARTVRRMVKENDAPELGCAAKIVFQPLEHTALAR